MIKRTLISILVPTRNRTEYAFSVIKEILKINDDRFQLIVQDNSTTDILKTLLEQNCILSDQRIAYFYHQSPLSFVDNFSIGISKCDGEYVTIIGDDDGINPQIIGITEWAFENNIEAITPTLPLVYYWPESGLSFDSDSGRLTIADFFCTAHFSDTKNELKKLLQNGCQNYLSYNLAKVYHGVVKRSILERLFQKTGYFVGGLSPDIYLSIGVSALIDKVLVIDYPLTISGICSKSGSADSATGRHTGRLSDAPHFIGRTNDYNWSTKVPGFYSVETIWADSAIAAIGDIYPEYSTHFSIEVLSAYCMLLYPEFRKEIVVNLSRNLQFSPNSIRMIMVLLKGIFYGPFFDVLIKVRNKLHNRKKVMIYDKIGNIESALNVIQSLINKQNTKMFHNLLKFKN